MTRIPDFLVFQLNTDIYAEERFPSYLWGMVDFRKSCCYPGATLPNGELVLPTLAFILCAYGTYALIRAWTRRNRRRFQPYQLLRRRRQLTLVGSTGVGVGIIILIAILGLPSQYGNLSSAGLISASWGQFASHSGQVMPSQEIMPIKPQTDSGQPVYASLHPGTPAAQFQEGKNASFPRPGNKTRLKKPGSPGKSLKTAVPVPKKEKAAAKQQAKNPKNKKKKPQSATDQKLAATAP
jgi:hypothetical protein